VSAASAAPLSVATLDQRCIDTIRTLSMDAVQKAESGHPGTPMALAPLAYRLYTKHMKHDPARPDWADRDRFVLSVGHASMLLYASLHLAGYDLPLEEIVRFRQWGSATPGHPEVKHTPGVETTTGPLGQGVANAVGSAIAEAHLAATFNKPGHTLVDHRTWFVAGDGCLMEGISHEAASLAGHLKLGKLIGFYDDNRITIDGSTDLALSDDAAKRFEAYGWQVLHVADINDLAAIDAAVEAAIAETSRPSMIIVRSVIGYGSPARAGTAKAHGEPLGVEEIAKTKAAYGWPGDAPFFVPEEAVTHMRAQVAERAAAHTAWQHTHAAYASAFPAEAAEFTRRLAGELPANWADALPTFDASNGSVASRAASGTVLGAIVGTLPELMGGSADLTGSNLTRTKSDVAFSAAEPAGRYLHYGVREHAMGAIMNGLALHGGIIPFGGTFLVFSDYMRPAIRLSALMKVRTIHVLTHDSIGLGEDGPTHQPIEHLAALRVIPGCQVLRPADAREVAACWRLAIEYVDGPTVLALSRQKLPFLDIPAETVTAGVARGAYAVTDVAAPQVVLLATGSEVAPAKQAAELLAAEGIAARVVSVPGIERFLSQDAAYRASLLPAGVPRLAVEAGHPSSWWRLVGETGDVIGLDHFGASAPADRLFAEFGFTPANVAARAKALLGR
jgi:transketolase